jgi:alpha-D-ribose 1-methylphosphonate 5-triphosphate synthase subunit PhnG
VSALVNGVHVAVRDALANQTSFHNKVLERVVTPLQTFYKQAETMHKQLLLDETKVLHSFLFTCG